MMENKTAFEVLVISTKQDDRQEWLSLPVSASTVQAAMSTGQYLRVPDVIDLTYNTEFYVLLSDVQNEMQLGHYYLYDSGMVDMPEQWKPAMDNWALGVTILAQEQGQFTPQSFL